MAEILFFKPSLGRSPEQHLADFINHCRDTLTLYAEQGGFAVDEWHYAVDGKKYAMTFSKYKVENHAYKFESLEEPFLSFAKSYVRYRQSENQNKNIADTMAILRTLHDALYDVYGSFDILNTDGLVQTRCMEIINERYPKSDKRYFYGGKLVNLFEFLVEKQISTRLPDWRNPWKKAKAKAERTDKASLAWQQERCPSLHQMLALADCFAKAETPQDKYWSSVIALLMFAPSRVGELNYLTVNSLHEDSGRLGVRWYGEKGYGFTVKWVPELLEDMVRMAFERLIEIGQPARYAAKFAFEYPEQFYRHDYCITEACFPDNAPLNALEFAHAMNFAPATIERLKVKTKNYNNITAWNVLNAHQTEWIQELRANGNPSYGDLAKYISNTYKSDTWPYLPRSDRPVWEALELIRDKEFHADHQPKGFSWLLPTVDQTNDQLSPRPLKNPIPTIFQRFGIKDEDGSDISLTTHQLRVWLSTNAERGGMDTWQLAQWAGRSRVEDNRYYDLRTKAERDEQVNLILSSTDRPTALEALQMNLPVSYQDLGIERIGIVDVTEYGMCTHDYSTSPCTKGGECMTCKEHVCIKGMPKTLERIQRLEQQVEFLLEKARNSETEGVDGAARWEEHFAWKLSHIRTQRIRLESENTPNGAVLWIPPEHDPSPIERALRQKGLETEPPQSELFDSAMIAKLLGLDDA